MIANTPKVLEQTGIAFSVQTIETTDNYFLIRIRTEEMIASGYHDTKIPAVSREKFTLSDGRETEVTMIQSSTQGDGPFAGIVDLAFPTDPGFDLGSPLTLASENTRLTFQF